MRKILITILITILLYNLFRQPVVCEGLDNKESIVIVVKALEWMNEAIQMTKKLRRNIDYQNKADLISYLTMFKDKLTTWRKANEKSKGDNKASLYKVWDENRSFLVSSEDLLDPTDKKHGEVLDRIKVVRQTITQAIDYVEPPDTDLESPLTDITASVTSLFQL